jgi:uncharacterized protein (TIGR02145 family)
MEIGKLIFTISFCICYLGGLSQETSPFTDTRDGKTYKTIKIGDQVWMAENLVYKPKNGTYSAWGDDAKNSTTYGYLYNWETAQKVCPNGWHMPSDNDWKLLEEYLKTTGGEYTHADQMKSENGWYDNANGKNTTGFNALPSGACLFYDYSYWFMTEKAYFWTSTPEGVDATGRVISYDEEAIESGLYSKNNRLSVRCIKDND